MASRLIAIRRVDTISRISKSEFKLNLNRLTLSSGTRIAFIFAANKLMFITMTNSYYLICSVHNELSLFELPLDMNDEYIAITEQMRHKPGYSATEAS